MGRFGSRIRNPANVCALRALRGAVGWEAKGAVWLGFVSYTYLQLSLVFADVIFVVLLVGLSGTRIRNTAYVSALRALGAAPGWSVKAAVCLGSFSLTLLPLSTS